MQTVERAGDAWPREERTEARYLALRILLMWYRKKITHILIKARRYLLGFIRRSCREYYIQTHKNTLKHLDTTRVKQHFWRNTTVTHPHYPGRCPGRERRGDTERYTPRSSSGSCRKHLEDLLVPSLTLGNLTFLQTGNTFTSKTFLSWGSSPPWRRFIKVANAAFSATVGLLFPCALIIWQMRFNLHHTAFDEARFLTHSTRLRSALHYP